MSSDKRKQSLYFSGDMLDEIEQEAIRQDRSLSWLVQQAWRLAKKELEKVPSTSDMLAPKKKFELPDPYIATLWDLKKREE